MALCTHGCRWSAGTCGRKRAACTGDWDPVSPRNADISGDRRAAKPPLCQKRGVKHTAWLTVLNASLSLSDLAERGSERGGVDGPGPLEGFGIDGDVDQGIEPTHRTDVAGFGPFNPKILGLAIDA